MAKLLKSVVLDALARFPDNDALNVDETTISYRQFVSAAQTLNSALQPKIAHLSRLGVLATKSNAGYHCIATAFLSEKVYVPLNAHYPAARNLEIIREAGLQVLLVDDDSRETALSLRAELDERIRLAIVRVDERDQLEYEWLSSDDGTEATAIDTAGDTAYLLFTSGSTGKPKGVPISDQNLKSYLDHINTAFSFSSSDRFSQFFEFTFDLSLHDLLVCWQNGACLCAPDKMSQLMPLQFALKKRLTVWFSVPSLPLTVKDLMRDRFIDFRLTDLRFSFFCGEALPTSLATQWQTIAPNAPVINLYGPTEATIAFTAHRFDAEQDAAHAAVPIGHALGDNAVGIFDENGNPCELGEVCLGGPQLFSGYWQKPELSASAFRSTPKISTVENIPELEQNHWYRTGDIGSWHANGTVLYHGRNDRQVQVNGFRVELQEVEQALRDIIETGTVAVVYLSGERKRRITGLTAFVTDSIDCAHLTTECRKVLPTYMIPTHFVQLARFPFNSNGKLDYQALSKIARDSDSLETAIHQY